MYDKLIERLRASCESCKLWDGYKCCLKGECSAQKSLQAANAIEELQSIIQQLQNTHDDLIDFLAFLFNHIPPNEMEHYWTMFHCLDVPTCGESEGE